MDMCGASLAVGVKPFDAVGAEDFAGVGQNVDAPKQRVRHEGQERIQVQAAHRARLCDRLVVGLDQQAHLRDRLGNHGVDLAGHDAAARLTRREVKLAKPRVRPGGKQAKVARDFHQIRRTRFENPADLHKHIHILGRINEILRPGQSQACYLAKSLHHAENILSRRAQSRADRGPAEVHRPQPLAAFIDPPAVARKGLAIRAHLPPYRGENRVLQLRAGDFHHVGELAFLFLKGLLQRDEIFLQGLEHLQSRHAQRGGIGVVRRLMQVHIVHRREGRIVARLVPEQLQCAIREHLIDVHIRARTGAALQRVDVNLLVEKASYHLFAGPFERGKRIGRLGPMPLLVVRPRAGEFDRPIGMNQRRRDGPAA